MGERRKDQFWRGRPRWYISNDRRIQTIRNDTGAHIAIINQDGSEDVSSAMAKGWVGTLERYRFTESKGSTTLTVTLDVSPEWEKMFQEGWPAALQALKNICEK
jgi:hypothetical protein